MQRQTALASCAVIMGLSLAGCGLFRGPEYDVEKKVRVPVQTTKVNVAGGTLTFYRYVKGQECGEGLFYQFQRPGGSSARGVGPCAVVPAMSIRALSDDLDEGRTHPFVVIYGQIHDRRITRVTITMQDQSGPVEAPIMNAWRYIFLDGHEDLPEKVRFEGLDADGTKVFSEAWGAED